MHWADMIETSEPCEVLQCKHQINKVENLKEKILFEFSIDWMRYLNFDECESSHRFFF